VKYVLFAVTMEVVQNHDSGVERVTPFATNYVLQPKYSCFELLLPPFSPGIYISACFGILYTIC
jgi:hypothetical protein